MKGKSKKQRQSKSDNDDWRIRPLDEEEYPWHIETDNFIYDRFYCTLTRIVYIKYKGDVRVSYYILPEQKDIYDFYQMIKYVDSKKDGETLCKFVLC